MTLYHGSKKEFLPGKVLLPQPDGYVNSPDDELAEMTERILEHHRPEQCLPRSQSVFLLEHSEDLAEDIERAGGYSDFIYEVEPAERVEKNDLHWYGKIVCYVWDSVEDPEAKTFAENYWNGVPSDRVLWEYRTSSAAVVRRVRV